MSSAVSMAILTLLATAALRSLVLVTAMEFVLRPVQKHAPRTALGLCKLTLLAALIMPALPYLLPGVWIPLATPAVLQRLAAHPAPSASPADTADVPTRVGPLLVASSGSAPIDSARPGTAHWLQILLGVYVAGVLVFAIRLAAGLQFARRLRRCAQTVHSPLARELVTSQSRHLGLRRPPPLLGSRAVITPVTVGLWRPAILLPESWNEWDRATCIAVLTHELGHAARRDPLALFLAELYRTLFWFHPAAWWLRRRLAELAEAASDDLVLATGIERQRYAAVLLAAVAAVQTAGGRLRWPVTAMARRARCRQRLERILAWQPGEGFFGSGAGRMLSVLALLASVGCIASVRLRLAPKVSTPDPSLAAAVAPSRDNSLDRHLLASQSHSGWSRQPGRPLRLRTESPPADRIARRPETAAACPSCPNRAPLPDSHRDFELPVPSPAQPAPAPRPYTEAERELRLRLQRRPQPPPSGSIEIWLRAPAIQQQILRAEQEAIKLEQIRSRLEQQMLELEQQLRHLPWMAGPPFNGVPAGPATHLPVPLERVTRPLAPPRLVQPARMVAPVLRATI